jgi:hypothetical protein
LALLVLKKQAGDGPHHKHIADLDNRAMRHILSATANRESPETRRFHASLTTVASRANAPKTSAIRR